jgi:hypothetical protein
VTMRQQATLALNEGSVAEVGDRNPYAARASDRALMRALERLEGMEWGKIGGLLARDWLAVASG